MKHEKLAPEKTEDLLAILIAFLELQIIAIGFKKTRLPDCCSKLENGSRKWEYTSGICDNLYNTESRLADSFSNGRIRSILFVLAPSSSGSWVVPVPEVGLVSYSSMNPNEFWGDHPYADNRRRLIQDCIDLLHEELTNRGYNIT